MLQLRECLIIIILGKGLVWLRTFILFYIPYFFSYKIEDLPFLNNPKDLDPSYKMDLDLWDCLGRVNLVLQQISKD